MGKGNIVGQSNDPTVDAASGVWSLQELFFARTLDTWPSLFFSDPYFKYVSLLLQGDGVNGGQNNTFIDSSTNNLTITRNGNTTQGSLSPYGNLWSNYFDGSDDYLTASSATAFDFGTGDFTIECWAYINSQSGSFTIIGATTGVNQYWAFGTLGSGGMSMYAGTAGTDIYSGTSSNPALNQWNHLVWQRASGVASMYLNGTRVYNAAYTADFGSSATGFTIGKSASYANYYTAGYISNLRVVKGSAVYSGTTISVPTTPLTAIANTSLLACQSNRFIDNSTNALALTTTGDVRVQKFNPFSPSNSYNVSIDGGSMLFDGTTDYLSITSPPASIRDWASTDFTVEAWIYPTTYTGWYYTVSSQNIPTLLGNNAATSTVNYWTFGIASATGQVRVYYWNGSAANYPALSTETVKLNQWNHIALTKTSAGFRYWVNGIGSGNIALSGTPASDVNYPFNIGAGNSLYINGYVSDVRIVKGTALYSSNFTPPTTPLTAVTNTSLLISGTNANIFDSSRNVNLETVGNAQISTSVKKYGTGSLAFDGNGDYLTASSNPSFDLTSGTFTVECWAYLSSVSGAAIYSYVIDIRNQPGANTIGFYFDSGIPKFTGAGFAEYGSTTAIPLNTWTHVAWSCNSGVLKIFINGAQTYSGTVSIPTSAQLNGMPLWIGRPNAYSYYLNGYIDDLRITKGVARYTANFTPPTRPFPTL